VLLAHLTPSLSIAMMVVLEFLTWCLMRRHVGGWGLLANSIGFVVPVAANFVF